MKHVKLKYPDWVYSAAKSIAQTVSLHEAGVLPESIGGFMIVTPARRLLRGVYGSDWSAIAHLLPMALSGTWFEVRSACWRFWRYRVMLKSPDQDLNDLIAEREADEMRKHEVP